MSRDGMNEVVITGWGAVTTVGAGRDAVARAFADGAPPLSEVDRSAGFHRPDGPGGPRGARRAALLGEVDLSEWISPRRARRMSPPSRLAVASARMALEQAGLPDTEETETEETEDDAGLPPPLAVVTSTSYGPSSYTEDLMRQIFLDSPTAASPSLFSEAVANAPAAQIALALGAHGPNLTVTQREAGPLLALAHAAETVSRGRARRAVVAATDEATPLLHAILDRFGVLAGSRSRRGAAEEVARPFDRHRSGFVLGEGGTALVVEDAAAAAARGARVVARMAGTLTGFDPDAPAHGVSADPSILADALARGLERLGGPAPDLVVSGACGSVTLDRLEALILRRALGALPPILVPKAYLGEHGAAILAGALFASEWGAAGTDHASVAPTPGFEEADPELGVEPFAGGPLSGGSLPGIGRILVCGLATGGDAAWTVLDLPGALSS